MINKIFGVYLLSKNKIMNMFTEPGDTYLHCWYVNFCKSVNLLLVIIESELVLSSLGCDLYLLQQTVRQVQNHLLG